MLAQAQARVQCHMPWSEPITSSSTKKTATATNSRAERAQQRAARHNPIYVDVLSDGSDFEDDRLNAKVSIVECVFTKDLSPFKILM